MRGRGAWIVLAGIALAAVGIVAFMAQNPRATPAPPPYAVASVAEVTGTPRAVSVITHRGADRVLQRESSGFFQCGIATMGCPGTTELRATTVLLVRDERGDLHAFIGEDPRNGCALEWKPLPPDYNWFIDGARVTATFYDVCHGSQYDRRGQRIGGPSPFDLNQLAVEIRGDEVFVDPGRVVVGACPGCPNASPRP